MYEAIVFLPLLGAVIAGVIALAGARNRLPGENPPPHDDHAAPSVHEDQAHAAPAPNGAHAVSHASHAEEAPTEPSAAGSLAAELITTTFLGIACVLSWYAFYEICFV